MYSIPFKDRSTIFFQGLSRLRDSKLEGLKNLRCRSSLFYCRSCATWRRGISTSEGKLARNSIFHALTRVKRCRSSTEASPHRLNNSQADPRARCLSTSAINVVGSRSVPPRLRELYDALNNVLGTAADHLSLSRLQLAIRGLESEDPVIRVAVLGLVDSSAAQRLVRLLLSDPLKAREPWEDVLESLVPDGSQPVLIRHGKESNIVTDGLLSTIFIPAPILKRGNMELLVSSLGVADEPPHVPISTDALLTPTITIRTSHSGRSNFVRYPVHKAILCGTGINGLLAYNTLLSRMNLGRESSSVCGAIDLLQTEGSPEGITFIDTKQADEALSKFRKSVKNATEYERGWTAGNVQPLIDWLSSITETGNQSLEPALQTLIEAILDTVNEEESIKEAQQSFSVEEAFVSDEIRRDLEQTISMWAERAHMELRNILEEGFASIRWRGLAWWKLFWRSDDVNMITSEILETRYLSQAEREMIWTAGKCKQAGFLKDSQGLRDLRNLGSSNRSESDSGNGANKPAELQDRQPWPMEIALSRSHLSNNTIPSLQALSQSLVLFSISTTGLTSALSALLYVSESLSLYESGAVAAVGLLYSFRRQQQKWEAARSFWEREVRETGRQALRETEIRLRNLTRGTKQPEEAVPKSQTRLAIDRAKKALDDVKTDY